MPLEARPHSPGHPHPPAQETTALTNPTPPDKSATRLPLKKLHWTPPRLHRLPDLLEHTLLDGGPKPDGGAYQLS